MATTPSLIVDVDRVTGDYISGWPRIQQSVRTILTTRIGTRLMRLWWGSTFADTMDKPMVQQVFATSMIAAIRYVNLYEPEFQVTSVALSPESDGSCTCVMTGTDLTTQTKKRVSTTVYSSS